jgi:hypothetical protein
MANGPRPQNGQVPAAMCARTRQPSDHAHARHHERRVVDEPVRFGL